MSKSKSQKFGEDEKWIRRAIRLAKRGKGKTSPNPMVGAILVKEGRVVGEGYHRRAGEAHAEIIAIQKAGPEAKGSTLYINLEPCVHYGKTPPCTPSIIESGVRRVVVGMEDPNPLVKGKGLEDLRRAGIEVLSGVIEQECRRLNEAFCKYITKREPFVILKSASTLNGKIATRTGESKWITGEASRHYVQKLRSEVDGIVVGIDTIIKDDPLLTVRIKSGGNPYRIVLDSNLRIPEAARVIETSPSRTIVVTTPLSDRDKIERLKKRGVQILTTKPKDGRVDLREFLSKLGQLDIISILVEGGSEVNGSFLDEGLIDKILLFFAPKIIGDPEAKGIFSGRRVSALSEAVSLRDIKMLRIGEDILIEAYISRQPQGEMLGD